MPRPKEPLPSPDLLSPSSLPTDLPKVEVSMVEAADVTGVTFTPDLWMQRRHWALDVLRREGVRSVLDVGAGPGALLETLIQPPATIQEAPLRRRTTKSGTPTGEPSVEGEEPELFLNRLAALDPEPSVLPSALSILAPPNSTSTSAAPTRTRRFSPLTTELWLGGIESYNQHLEGYEAMVALEVIEHLDPLVLSRFGVVCLGTYRPRLLLISTPNFDFNAKFPRHDDHGDGENNFARKGFIDPTGRTERVFRHSDHKLEMTSAEFASWANSAAQDWGYEVELSGVGLSSSPSYYPSDHHFSPNAPIFASQVALFRLASGIPMRSPRSVRSSELPWLSKETAHPHKLVGRFLLPSTIMAEAAGRHGKKAGVEEVQERVRALLTAWKIGEVSLGELWGDSVLAAGLCGGSKRWLVGCLGGWGDQVSLLEDAAGEGEFHVGWDDPGRAGRGMTVRWNQYKAAKTEEDEGRGMKELPPREEPSEKTGGW
ncbi:uncharacterized protein MKK02DRAFT_23746 [Dioszegia hungarica]|uniref:Small RNA 2'-O-methyltransferase n=1 Tax=Dioszegia hungarica TaxID=4972 RepID=A0AA38HDZ9_9TREE|nr:uncharacterized protein MKK02DRAFT_23746 [Dioszegia hungarica]KAI9637196.1 hypothetical protein MKK02DRAFT_23746 [Dioszegia hungarica]